MSPDPRLPRLLPVRIPTAATFAADVFIADTTVNLTGRSGTAKNSRYSSVDYRLVNQSIQGQGHINKWHS